MQDSVNAAELIAQADRKDRELLAEAEALAAWNGTAVEVEFEKLLAARELEERLIGSERCRSAMTGIRVEIDASDALAEP